MAKVGANDYPTPHNLNEEAKQFWKRMMNTYQFRLDELRILKDCCREIDIIERIERELKTGEATVKGSQGQPVANPLFAEARQHRSTLASLLKQLKLGEAIENTTVGHPEVHGDNVVAVNDWRSR